MCVNRVRIEGVECLVGFRTVPVALLFAIQLTEMLVEQSLVITDTELIVDGGYGLRAVKVTESHSQHPEAIHRQLTVAGIKLLQLVVCGHQQVQCKTERIYRGTILVLLEL